MTRLSVTIVAWNEEERLRACLESVAWADEIVVVDGESTDKTVALAREFTDRVWVRPWPGFAAQKNFALEQASGDWVLALDADERVTPDLHARITLLDRDNRVITHLADDPGWRAQVLADNFRIRSQPERWENGRFVHPHDACFDRDGNIYVAEWVAVGRVSFLRHVG